MYCPKLGAQPLNRPALPDVPVSQVGLQRGEAKLGQAGVAALPDHAFGIVTTGTAIPRPVGEACRFPLHRLVATGT